MKKSEKPLVVDLDGCLIKADLLHEAALALLKKNPFYLFNILYWLLSGGKVLLKNQIAERININAAILPYHPEFIAYLKKEKAKRVLILATGSPMKWAQSINTHLKLFSNVIGTTSNNLTGANKADVLVLQYGEQGFDYAGNAYADFKVWDKCDKAIVVNAPNRLEKQVRLKGNLERSYSRTGSRFKSFMRALRPHQWVKNSLIFVPLASINKFGLNSETLNAAMAFTAFSLCASAVYVLNDMLDIDDDRHHRSKKKRPFAAGDLSITAGLVTVPVLLTLSLGLSFKISLFFMIVLSIYIVITSAYSVMLKKVMLVDVFCLAFLYTIRIIAGTVLISEASSFWIFAFSVLIFLSLATVKRYAELIAKSGESAGEKLMGRDYLQSDKPILRSIGIASGFSALVVFALYINSDIVQDKYYQPELLWGTATILLYWINYVWFTAHRGNLHDDPVIFALKDPISIVLVTLGAVFMALAVLEV